MKKIIFLLLVSMVFSCKNETKNKTRNEIQNEDLEKEIVYNKVVFENDFNPNFEVEINAVLEKNDVITVFYLTENFDKHFIGTQTVSKSFTGDKNDQNIKIKLPTDSIPTKLRFDFGNNRDQNKMKLNTIKLTYEDRSITFKDSIFSKYLNINNFMELTSNHDVNFREATNNNIYDPYVIGTVLFQNKISELTNSKI